MDMVAAGWWRMLFIEDSCLLLYRFYLDFYHNNCSLGFLKEQEMGQDEKCAQREPDVSKYQEVLWLIGEEVRVEASEKEGPHGLAIVSGLSGPKGSEEPCLGILYL